MRTVVLSVPEVAFVGATRGALGLGAGLLLAGKLAESHRRIVGLSLLTLGVATTIPIARRVFGSHDEEDGRREPPAM